LTGEGQGGGVSGVNRIITLGKALRKRPTDAEQLLWRYLKMKQMEGLKFRRQQPIDNYIVDFVCFENRIIIEVDGGQHAAENHKDRERDSYLQQLGFKVLRFWNNEVLQNTNGVLETIRRNCLSHPPLNPLPSREGKKSRVPVQSPPVKGG
jgi:very-short-patch-repair endonuclease